MQATSTMPDIRDLALFDSCVTLGRLPLESVPECLTVGNILDVMDKYDIAEALVHSNEARLVLPRSRGNERLSETIAGMDRLHPVWALSPPAWPPGNWAEEMVERMRSSGVRVARLMMGHVPPLEWIWSPLLEALQARRVVCMLDFAPLRAPSTQCLPDDLTVDRLADLCGRFADLPMILSHHSGGLGISPVALHLLRRCRNVRIEGREWHYIVPLSGSGRLEAGGICSSAILAAG